MPDAPAILRSVLAADPTVVIRAPGRINLIGDHTDYCGLSVLPMAIEPSIQIAAAPDPRPVVTAVSSIDGRTFSSVATTTDPGWAPYLRAVLRALGDAAADRGARLAIDGDLPATGGLSSSSALTVGCIIALDRLWDLRLDAAGVITTAIAAERAAAIAGGAMDQTVISLARPGHALRIDFDPPHHRHIPMPAGFSWIAGYSGTAASKGATARAQYHSFVLSARAAAALLGTQLDRDPGMPPLLARVREAPAGLLAGLPTLAVGAAAELTGGDDLGLPAARSLDLRIAAEHVLSEADRVDTAERALLAADADTLGRLMNDSHASLRRYGASTAGLDRLVAAAIAAGAVGARLTGAGFGGWAIALANPAAAAAVQEAMERAGGGPTFVATPGAGALWPSPEE